MKYPSRIITMGERDSVLVKQIQTRINQLLCGPIAVDGIFGIKTTKAIAAYQCWHHDVAGNTLADDGKIGPLTWWSLFEEKHELDFFSSPLLYEVINIAQRQIGISEDPPGSNRGPTVSAYLRSVSLAPGNPWCAAFVYWCFDHATALLNRVNPLVKMGSCMSHWKKTTGCKITGAEALHKPSLIEPGLIFIISRGHGKGHTGIVTGYRDGYITTIEGNANGQLSAEGSGVVDLVRRLDSINVGFIKYD